MIGYEFLPQAEEEMNETASFYEGESEGLGLDFLDSVERSIESILTYPLSGAEISKNIRRRIVRRFRYDFGDRWILKRSTAG